MGYFNLTVKNIGWSGTNRISIRIISIVRTAILARLLVPDQFGLFAIATLALAFLEVFLETGVNVFLIQEKSDIRKYIDSAWVVSIIRGIFMFAILALSAPFIANFFNNSEAVGILIFMSFVPLLRGFINPSIVYFQKEIQFHKEFGYRLVLYAIDAIVTVIIALITHSAYSLVVGLFISALIEVFISFKFVSPRPKLSFNKNYLRLIFHRGKWVTLYGVFAYLAKQGDTIAVGRLLNTQALGQYNIAYTIATLPIEATDVVNPVVFPVYVKISHDLKRLWRAFIKTTAIITLGTGALCALLYLFAEPLVRLFLGPVWLPIVPVLKLLLIYGILRATFGSVTALFQSVGKQKYITIMTFTRVTALLATIVPAITIAGLEGAAYSVIFSVLVEIPLIIYLVWRVFMSRKSKK